MSPELKDWLSEMEGGEVDERPGVRGFVCPGLDASHQRGESHR